MRFKNTPVQSILELFELSLISFQIGVKLFLCSPPKRHIRLKKIPISLDNYPKNAEKKYFHMLKHLSIRPCSSFRSSLLISITMSSSDDSCFCLCKYHSLNAFFASVFVFFCLYIEHCHVYRLCLCV